MTNSPGTATTYTLYGDIAGTSAILNLELIDTSIHAKIDASGYIYKLHLQMESPQIATGFMEDAAGQKIGAALALNEQGMTLIVDKPTGPEEILFTHTPPAQADPAAAATSTQHDPRLIGGWRNSQSYSSGEFSITSEFTMEFRADGTYVEYEGRVAGGIGGVGGDTGPGSGQMQLYWRSENGMLFGGNHPDQLQPFARYQVDASSLLIMPQNGERAFYSRIY